MSGIDRVRRRDQARVLLSHCEAHSFNRVNGIESSQVVVFACFDRAEAVDLYEANLVEEIEFVCVGAFDEQLEVLTRAVYVYGFQLPSLVITRRVVLERKLAQSSLLERAFVVGGGRRRNAVELDLRRDLEVVDKELNFL